MEVCTNKDNIKERKTNKVQLDIDLFSSVMDKTIASFSTHLLSDIGPLVFALCANLNWMFGDNHKH